MTLHHPTQLDLFPIEDTCELQVLSYGIGQDSWALLVRLVKDPLFRARYPARRFLVIASATGNEHPETYLHLTYTREFCSQNGIEFVYIDPKMGYHAAGWQSLEHQWSRNHTIGSKAYPKTCTDQLKIQPIYRFLEAWLGREYHLCTGAKLGYRQFAAQYGKIQMMIGFTAEERNRMSGESPQLWRREAIQMMYPLIEEGWTRQDCQDYLHSVDEPIPLPSNCMMCCWSSDLDVLWLYRNYPEMYDRWVEHERLKLETYQNKGEKNLGVFGRRTLPEVLDSAFEKYKDWSSERINEYKFSHGHCVMSKY